MQSKSFDELLNDARERSFDSAEVAMPRMKQLAADNQTALAKVDLPDYLRIPTAEELATMREWAIALKKAFPTTSRRQLRKATQQHFNIRIYK